MIPHSVYYQLAVVGFLWLCIMLHSVWPSQNAVSYGFYQAAILRQPSGQWRSLAQHMESSSRIARSHGQRFG